MKFYKLILASILCFSYVEAQSYKTDFKADMCNCLEEESLKRKLTDNAFKVCLRETLPKYATQIDAEIVEEDVNLKFQKGQLARKDLMYSMYYELIYSCDVYYKHLDYERNSKKLIARENANESDLEKYNQLVGLSPNAMSYFMRAQVYFNLGQIKEAESDINKSLELNPNRENNKSTRRELLLLAWVYEEQERYTDAVALYDKVYFGELDTQVVQLRALAHKKSGGSASGFTIITKEDDVKINKVDRRRTPGTRSRGSKETAGKTRTNSESNAKKTSTKAKKKKDTASLRKLLKIGG